MRAGWGERGWGEIRKWRMGWEENRRGRTKKIREAGVTSLVFLLLFGLCFVCCLFMVIVLFAAVLFCLGCCFVFISGVVPCFLFGYRFIPVLVWGRCTAAWCVFKWVPAFVFFYLFGSIFSFYGRWDV